MTGKCHVCKMSKDIKYCGGCQHWFCEKCKYHFDRAKSFFDELINGRQANCCGPKAEIEVGQERGSRVGSSPDTPLLAIAQPRSESLRG